MNYNFCFYYLTNFLAAINLFSSWCNKIKESWMVFVRDFVCVWWSNPDKALRSSLQPGEALSLRCLH